MRYSYFAGVTVGVLAALFLSGCNTCSSQPAEQKVVYSLKPFDAGPLADPCIAEEKLTDADNASEKAFIDWSKRNGLTRRECEVNHSEIVRILREKGILTPATPASAASR